MQGPGESCDFRDRDVPRCQQRYPYWTCQQNKFKTFHVSGAEFLIDLMPWLKLDMGRRKQAGKYLLGLIRARCTNIDAFYTLSFTCTATR